MVPMLRMLFITAWPLLKRSMTDIPLEIVPLRVPLSVPPSTFATIQSNQPNRANPCTRMMLYSPIRCPPGIGIGDEKAPRLILASKICESLGVFEPADF